MGTEKKFMSVLRRIRMRLIYKIFYALWIVSFIVWIACVIYRIKYGDVIPMLISALLICLFTLLMNATKQ